MGATPTELDGGTSAWGASAKIAIAGQTLATKAASRRATPFQILMLGPSSVMGRSEWLTQNDSSGLSGVNVGVMGGFSESREEDITVSRGHVSDVPGTNPSPGN